MLGRKDSNPLPPINLVCLARPSTTCSYCYLKHSYFLILLLNFCRIAKFCVLLACRFCRWQFGLCDGNSHGTARESTLCECLAVSSILYCSLWSVFPPIAYFSHLFSTHRTKGRWWILRWWEVWLTSALFSLAHTGLVSGQVCSGTHT